MAQDDPAPYTPEEEERLRKIEEELEKVKGVQFAEPEDRDARLDAIEEQARRARAGFEKHRPENVSSGFVTKDTGKGLGLGLQVAYAIIGVPIVGFGVGYAIDMAVGGVFWRGILTIAGATAAVWYAMRSVNRS